MFDIYKCKVQCKCTYIRRKLTRNLIWRQKRHCYHKRCDWCYYNLLLYSILYLHIHSCLLACLLFVCVVVAFCSNDSNVDKWSALHSNWKYIYRAFKILNVYIFIWSVALLSACVCVSDTVSNPHVCNNSIKPYHFNEEFFSHSLLRLYNYRKQSKPFNFVSFFLLCTLSLAHMSIKKNGKLLWFL